MDNKKQTGIFIRCSFEEKKNWNTAFPYREVCRTARRLLNAAAEKKLKRKK